MKYGKHLIIIIMLSILCSACDGLHQDRRSDNSDYQLSFDEVLNEINDKHRAIIKPVFDLESFEAKYVCVKEPRELSLGKPQAPETAGKLSVDQMKWDACILMRNLRTAYSLYDYYGGDKKFDAVLTEMEAAIERNGEMEASKFAGLLRSVLDFIDDRHFSVGGASYSPFTITAFYRDTAFGKKDGKYINLETGLAVEQVDGVQDLDSLFHLSISDDYQLVYYPIVQSQISYYELYEKARDGIREEKAAALHITYIDGSKQTLTGVKDYRGLIPTVSVKADIHESNGIPVLRTTAFDGSVQAALMQEFVENYGRHASLVVDLRVNKGGYARDVWQWFESYTNHITSGNSFNVHLGSLKSLYSLLSYPDKTAMEARRDFQEIGDKYVIMDGMDDEFIDNPDRLLIVLMGKSTASSAELFIDYGYNVENVLFVGDASGGALINNLYYSSVKLPYSYIPVSMGDTVRVFPDEAYFCEGRGFLPDIWVPSTEAEDLICGFLQKLQEK